MHLVTGWHLLCRKENTIRLVTNIAATFDDLSSFWRFWAPKISYWGHYDLYPNFDDFWKLKIYIIYNTLLHVINNLNLQNSNNCKGNTKLQIAFNVLNWRLWCKFLISQNRQNKVINRHMVNMIFLELKIVQMTINCQIWQL